ncbi:hypothetical protein BH10PLA2_BH10PLA2_33050 [soil metagenome]
MSESTYSGESRQHWHSRPGWGMVFCFVPFLLVGAVALLLGGRNAWLAQECLTWPSISGVIVASEIEAHDEMTAAKIRYEYVVEGKILEGRAVSFGDVGSSDSSHAQAIVKKYPVGTQVSIFYEPSNPTRSVLEPGLNLGLLLVPAVGAIFLIVGSVLAFIIPRLAASGRQLAELEKSKLTADRSSFGSTWRTSFAFDSPEPYWRDSPNYGSLFTARGSQVYFEEVQGALITRAHRFGRKAWQIALFIPIFGGIPYFMGASTYFVSVSVSFPLLILLMLLANHIWLRMTGGPLILDSNTRTVSLPPSCKEWAFSSVVAFQWLRHSKLKSSETRSELNLLVREGDEVIRYPVLCDPDRQQVSEIVAFTGLTLDEVEVCDTTNWDSVSNS